MPESKTYNRITTGYLVTSCLSGQNRTYACVNEKGLHDLIIHLTGREPSTFSLRDRIPLVKGVSIARGLHIYQ